MRFKTIVALAALATGMLFASARPATAAGKPNIVIIVADDQGYADLGIHGGKDIPTPNIDALAKSGTRFTSGYVSGPYCSPTRAGLLTGRYQQRFGHEFNPGPNPVAGKEIGLSLDETPLPAKLKSAGYTTAMVGKWHLGNTEKLHPLSRGFDSFFGFLGGAHSYVDWKAKGNSIMRGREPLVEETYLTDAFGREAAAFIGAQKDAQKPFFLYLTFNAVHTPMDEPPAKYAEAVKNIPEGKRRTYAAMTVALDANVGLVLGKLKEVGKDQDTLVMYISDNGGPPVNASSNTPLRGYKAQTLEGGVRVPYFLSWPGKVAAGATYEHPVIQLDMHTTALAAAGYTAPADAKPLDGVDLLPFLAGEKKDAPHDALYWRFGKQAAIRQGDWKLVRHPGSNNEWELYNLKDDIGESKNLAATQADKMKELLANWEKWDKTLVAPAWGQANRAGNANPGAKPGEPANPRRAKRKAAKQAQQPQPAQPVK